MYNIQHVHVYIQRVYMTCTTCMQVVEILLAKGANFEHRNVSDYTPLSLAASGGYVNIIKMLLRAGADINSRSAETTPTQLINMYTVPCVGSVRYSNGAPVISTISMYMYM